MDSLKRFQPHAAPIRFYCTKRQTILIPSISFHFNSIQCAIIRRVFFGFLISMNKIQYDFTWNMNRTQFTYAVQCVLLHSKLHRHQQNDQVNLTFVRGILPGKIWIGSCQQHFHASPWFGIEIEILEEKSNFSWFSYEFHQSFGDFFPKWLYVTHNLHEPSRITCQMKKRVLVFPFEMQFLFQFNYTIIVFIYTKHNNNKKPEPIIFSAYVIRFGFDASPWLPHTYTYTQKRAGIVYFVRENGFNVFKISHFNYIRHWLLTIWFSHCIK